MATKKITQKANPPKKSKKSLRLSERYPRCKASGLKVRDTEDRMPYITKADINAVFADKGSEFSIKFNKLFGVQTAPIGGFYAHDVEAVLERMESGRLTGTQAFWD
jgi:hypothetical protein